MRNVIIWGSGFIGSHIIGHLSSGKRKIICIDKTESEYTKQKGIKVHNADILNKKKIAVVIVRPPIIYGPRMNKVSGAAKIFGMMRKKISIGLGDMQNFFSVCYVKNLAYAMVHFSQKHKHGNHIYIIADREKFTQEAFCREIEKAFNNKTSLIKLPSILGYLMYWSGEFVAHITKNPPFVPKEVLLGITTNAYYYDISKAQKSGYIPDYSTSQGIKETVEWLSSKDHADIAHRILQFIQ